MRRNIKPIPTKYKGVTFKSRLESRFAEWCHTHNHRWMYEPEALGDFSQGYVPDFYLPESKLIVEIKPPFFVDETYKMDLLLNASEFNKFSLVVASMESELSVLRYSESLDDDALSFEAEINSEFKRSWDICGQITAGFCKKCGSLHFYGYGSWKCRGCGYYDGDQTHDSSIGCFDACA